MMAEIQSKAPGLQFFGHEQLRKVQKVNNWSSIIVKREAESVESSSSSSNENSLECGPAKSFTIQTRTQYVGLDSLLMKRFKSESSSKIDIMCKTRQHSDLTSGSSEKGYISVDSPETKHSSSRSHHETDKRSKIIVFQNSPFCCVKRSIPPSTNCRQATSSNQAIKTKLSIETKSTSRHIQSHSGSGVGKDYRNKRDRNNLASQRSRRRNKMKQALLLLELEGLEERNRLLQEKERLFYKVVKEVTSVAVLFLNLFQD